MGVAIRRRTATSEATTTPSGVVVPDLPGMVIGVAVSIRGGGIPEFRLAGALSGDNGGTFYGFLANNGVAGQTASVITGRGSIVTPSVEGGVPLVVDQEVYLSRTPGQVTQTPPAGVSGARVLLVGVAISSTQIALLSDASHWVA